MAEELNEIKKAFREVRAVLNEVRPRPFLQIANELFKALKSQGSYIPAKMTETLESEEQRGKEVSDDATPSMTSPSILPFRPLLSLKEAFPIRRAVADSIRAISEATKRKIEAEAAEKEAETRERLKWWPKGSIKLRGK